MKTDGTQNENLTDVRPAAAENETVFLADKFENYNLNAYKNDVCEYGLKRTWAGITRRVLDGETQKAFLNAENFADLYEAGLALENKLLKKQSGQYFTPDDVAAVMADWFDGLEGENVCDAGCGTGRLILSYFKKIGFDETRKLISSGRLYLYDTDETALNVCKTIIALKYGKDLVDKINCVTQDFLDEKLTLPKNCKVISNPPYSIINAIPKNWAKTEVTSCTKELYAAFMEKIITQSKAAVIITPYSFIGGNKFYALRKLMNARNGFIVSFDNVPGNIFCGKKHGIFNTNSANSVRAAITVVTSRKDETGFKLSPLIRFKNSERKKLLEAKTLENFIYQENQVVSEADKKYYKCDKSLGGIWKAWRKKSRNTLANYLNNDGKYLISVPTTCRYYTTAFNGVLNRTGQTQLRFADKDVFNYVFCLINSSFVYWYWRLYDGGITYPKGLLESVPVFFDLLTDGDKKFFEKTAEEMIARAGEFIITKNNVGVQENIKYPAEYRNKINAKLLKILGLDEDESVFEVLHAHSAFGEDN